MIASVGCAGSSEPPPPGVTGGFSGLISVPVPSTGFFVPSVTVTSAGFVPARTTPSALTSAFVIVPLFSTLTAALAVSSLIVPLFVTVPAALAVSLSTVTPLAITTAPVAFAVTSLTLLVP